MSHSHLIFPVFFLSALCSPALYAQDDLFDMSLDQLMDLPVVTASRYQETVQGAAAVISVVTSEQIKRSGAGSLYQLLEQVTSFYMTGSFFFPNNVSAIRGDVLTHADNHLLILLNGKPLRESYSGGINFAIYNAFPLQALDRVEVIRGPGSVLYGSNAFSGVINLVTTTAVPAVANVTLGQQGYSGAGFGLSGQQNDWRWQLSTQYNRQDGWDFGSYDSAGRYEQIDYGQNNGGLYASLAYQGWQLDVTSLHSRQDFFGAATNWSGVVAPEDRNVDSHRHQLTLSHKWQQSEQWWLDSAFSLSRMDFSHYNYDAWSADQYLELNQHWKSSAALSWQIGGSLWWQNFGTDAGLAAAPVADTSNRRDTAFVQLDWAVLPDLKWSAGLQYNSSSRTTGQWVPRLGLVWQFSPKWSAKLLKAKAYRDPYGLETDFYLILKNAEGNITGGLRGNPQLAAEQVDTVDLQLLHQSESQKFSLTLFHSQADQLISRQRAADRVIDFVNRGDMVLKGAELELARQWLARWSAEFALTYQRNQVNDIDDFTTVPHWLAKSSLTYQGGKSGLMQLQLNYTGAADDIVVRNANRQPLNPNADAYWLVNLNWRVPLHPLWSAAPAGMELQTTLYNVLDEAIYQPEFVGQSINTIPARAGRWGRVQLSWTF